MVLGCGVQGLGSRAWLGIRVSGSGLRVLEGSRVQGFGFGGSVEGHKDLVSR